MCHSRTACSLCTLCQFLHALLRASTSVCDQNTTQKEQCCQCLCITLGSFGHFKVVLFCNTQQFFSVFTLPGDFFFVNVSLILKSGYLKEEKSHFVFTSIYYQIICFYNNKFFSQCLCYKYNLNKLHLWMLFIFENLKEKSRTPHSNHSLIAKLQILPTM